MNKAIITGRLSKDVELKFTPGNGIAVATFSLAVDRKFKKEGQPTADFINIVAWGKTAEAAANYLHKGSMAGIVGTIQTRTYETKDGSKRYVTEVVADEVDFLDPKKQENKGYKATNDDPPF